MLTEKSNIWFKSVKEPFFTYLHNGQKTVEGRLYREDWKKMKVGDTIIWFSNPNGFQGSFEIIGLYKCPDFSSLYRLFGKQLLPNEDPCIYRSLYSKEEEKAFGVIGVEVRKL